MLVVNNDLTSVRMNKKEYTGYYTNGEKSLENY